MDQAYQEQQDQLWIKDQEPYPSPIPWLAQETLSSHYLELNPQTLTQAPLFAWMDHVCWMTLHHLKGKIQVLLPLNPLQFFFNNFSFGLWIFLARNFGFHPKGLEEWIFKCCSLILVARNSPKSQANLPCSILISLPLF